MQCFCSILSAICLYKYSSSRFIIFFSAFINASAVCIFKLDDINNALESPLMEEVDGRRELSELRRLPAQPEHGA